MPTVKSMVMDKLQKSGRTTDDECVRGVIKQQLAKVCVLLPCDDCKSPPPESKEFVEVMFQCNGSNRHDCAVNALVERAMDERDDLANFKALREKLVSTITSELR
jgi:hypothetical protein